MTGEHWHYPDGWIRYHPTRYASTGDGMLAVIEAMRALGWNVNMATNEGDDERWAQVERGNDTYSYVFAPTLPEAVARAAFEALSTAP